MRTGTVWGLTVALALGMGAGRAAAQQPAAPTAEADTKPGFFARLFGKKAEPPQADPAREESRPPTLAESAAAIQAREKEAYLRRSEVCDRLKAIAAQTGDDNLTRRADQLEQRAWALYRQRTGAESVLAGAGVFHSDQDTLSQHLGGQARADEAPVPPNLTLRALENDGGRTAARREP